MKKMQLLIAGLVVFVLLAPAGFSQASSARAKQDQQQTSELEQEWKELRKKDPAAWEKFKASLVLDAQQALGNL